MNGKGAQQANANQGPALNPAADLIGKDSALERLFYSAVLLFNLATVLLIKEKTFWPMINEIDIFPLIYGKMREQGVFLLQVSPFRAVHNSGSISASTTGCLAGRAIIIQRTIKEREKGFQRDRPLSVGVFVSTLCIKYAAR